MALPEGTVTFLRSDIEGSMDLARELGARYDELNADHQALVREAVREQGGHVVRTEGDAFFVVFTDASAASRAAAGIQRAMAEHSWPDGLEPRLRIGLHAGTAHRAGDDYGGFEVNRAARIAAVGWGGQIVLSDPARALIAADLPEGWGVRDLGRHRLKGIAEPELLFQLDAEGLAASFPPLRSGVGPADRLPERVTTLIGREDDLEALGRLLGQSRLLTLTGAGGTGKTSLALELARRRAGDYADGAAFVDLQALRDPTLVKAEIAHGIGLFDGAMGTAAERMDAYLGSRELLLVIDNFEQVIEAAMVVADALAASPESRIIVTSRVALKLRAEQEFAVRPMRVEATDGRAESDCVRLFVDRARRVRPDLTISDADADAVAEICQRVDGLPLAIELCAARAATLPLGAIRDRLRGHQALPGSGPRDLPDRQRTIEQTVAWSYDLLEPALKRLFWRLAAFEESLDHEQAEVVCGPAPELGVDVLDGLVRLAEQSLLTRYDDPGGGLRFGWLETIRSHALARLADSGEGDAVRARHARAFADLALEAAAHLPGGEQPRWLDRLAADDANLRAASRHALEVGDVESALRLVGSLWRYWLQSGRLSEGRDLVSRALALPGADAATPLRVRALDAAGGLAYWSGDIAGANAVYEEELQVALRIGDRAGEALACVDLFFTRESVGDTEGYLAARDNAEAIMRELGDEFGLERLAQIGFLVMMARGLHDPATFIDELGVRAAQAEASDDSWLSRMAPAYRGLACLQRGEFGAALGWLVRGERADLAVRERPEAALGLQFGVIAALPMGRPDVAATNHGAAQAAFEQLGIRPPATYAELSGMDPIPLIREALGVEAFEAAVMRGSRLSLEEAIDVLEEVATAAT